MLALLASACGANPESAPEEAPATPIGSDEGDEGATDDDGDSTEPAPPAEPAEEAPVEPPVAAQAEPIDVEAGVRLGPIRIGMSLEEVQALGLDERVINPRTTGFGPYQVSFRDGSVRRVEAVIGELERIRFGESVIEAGAHISQIRDTFADCVWTEGGGERYRCADGTLTVRTTHTMDPQRYTVGVAVR